jgi:hypothetical protein
VVKFPHIHVLLIVLAIILTDVHPSYADGFTVKQAPAPIRYGGDSTNAETAYHNNALYVAYTDADFLLTVARQDLITGEWTKDTEIDRTIGYLDPSHNQIALAVDGDGYIHVWYGMHDFHGLRYARSNEPESVTTGFKVRRAEFPDVDESYTYPHAATAPNGDIYFSIRNQWRYLPLFRWDNAQKTWTKLAVFASGHDTDNTEQTYTPYLPWLFVDSTGNVHIKWDWAFGSSRSERHMGSYALYKPDTGKFYRANGQEYQLPITVETADTFQPMPQGVTWDHEGIALSNMTVDAHNQPIISYAFSPRGNANQWEHRVARWDGTAWVRTILTTNTRKWNKNFVIASPAFPDPANMPSQLNLYYYARTNLGTELWISTNQGVTWRTAGLIFDRPLDGAIATLPYEHVLLHLSSSQRKQDSDLSYVSFGVSD